MTLDSEGELIDALRAGDAQALREALSQMTMIDGSLKTLLADLLNAAPSLRGEFSKRLGFRRWPPPKSSPHSTATQAVDPFMAALQSGVDNTLALAINDIPVLDGKRLELFRNLLNGVPELKSEYKKRIDLIGWSAGRPPGDRTFKRTKEENFCRLIEKRVLQGEKLEAVVRDMKGATGLSRSSLMKLWGLYSRKKRAAM